jgi:polyisoprenoid-binding protein YceI
MTMHKFFSLTLSTVLALGLSTSAHALEYKSIQAEKSSVTFNYKQMGVAMDGKFKKFSSQLSFDPAKVAAAKATIDIELASIDTGSSDADQEVVGKAWFNTATFPKAVFVSSQIKQTAPNQYQVVGKLTIKGQTKEISFPLKHTPQGTTGQFTGGFTLHRADFLIGEGMWAKFDVVANDIQVNFQLTANAGK